MGVTTRFAYVYHRRDRLTVYLRGKDDDGDVLERLVDGDGVHISRRHSTGSSWDSTPYYLGIDSEVGVRSSIPLVLYAAHLVMDGEGKRVYLSPSEESYQEMAEGARTTIQVSRIERDPNAREKCISIFGATCAVCGFDFEKTYGQIGAGFVHVHHLKPLSEAKGRRKVDPKSDLRPVCPNCHEMLHRQRPPFTIEELQGRIVRN
jgi:5-methylcytosine-specific restriction protein A